MKNVTAPELDAACSADDRTALTETELLYLNDLLEQLSWSEDYRAGYQIKAIRKLLGTANG